MNNQPELKPCPFCGSKAYFGPHTHYPEDKIIKCRDMGTKLCPSSGPIAMMGMTEAEAIKAWNTRHGDA